MSRQLLSGHKVKQESEEVVKNMKMLPFIHGVVRILPEGWLYPGTAPTFIDRISNMKFRSDDVMVMTFPKSGTTWMQEIVWTMLHNPNLDNPKEDETIFLRSPDLSFDMIFDSKSLGGSPIKPIAERFKEIHPGKEMDNGVMADILEALGSPRVIKNHFPFPLLPRDILDTIKVVYVARNPKDMTTSFWNFFRSTNVHEFRGDIDSFARLIMNDGMIYCPYWPHVMAAWEKRHHPNLHFVFYEDLISDIMYELRKINEFLGARLSKEKLEAIKQHMSFSSMKSRGEPLPDDAFKKEQEKAVFFRKGIVGDWKNNFSPELQEEMDQWIKKNLTDTDLNLSWALAE
ncbi:sulfotransferase 1E1-like isoform X1 [Scylla paramamosain]|uniref:sulfotransferase 1E1-like isoform X1 n=1 Tax=Scylla paramamosain TaxID=85552 RepID=UPI003083AEEB